MRSFLNNQSIGWTAGRSISLPPVLCGMVGCIRWPVVGAATGGATTVEAEVEVVATCLMPPPSPPPPASAPSAPGVTAFVREAVFDATL